LDESNARIDSAFGVGESFALYKPNARIDSAFGVGEKFTNPNPATPNPDGTGKSFRSGPADTDSSYKLLADTIRPTDKTGLTTIGSEKCYNTNYQSKIELVGNLNQRTNNYRHQYPDTCAGTRQEMILGFYEPTPLA
jgi:hypothetical protein